MNGYIATFNDLAPARPTDDLELLRKQYRAVLDQRNTLLNVVRELRAEIEQLVANQQATP